ncbi:MAG: DUF5615 family PIN-like protein [Bacteroidota bacterium]
MAKPIAFYTDEHIHGAIIEALRRREHDVLTASEADMIGAEDVAHLRRAAAENRTLITRDDDFLRLHAQGIPHAGIVYAHQQRASIGDFVRGLLMIVDILSGEDMINHIEFI